MKEEDKNKSLSAEDLFRIIDAGSVEPAMDDFEKEALEGLKMVKNRDRLQRINERIDEELRDKKNKRGVIFWISAAASLVFVIGLVYMIAPKLNQPEKDVAVAETKSMENNNKINSDGELTDNNVQEITVNGDSVSFAPEEKADEETVVRNRTGFKGEGQPFNYKSDEAVAEQKMIVTESEKSVSKSDELSLGYFTDVKALKDAELNENGKQRTDTSKLLANTITTTASSTQLNGVVNPSTNAMPYYSYVEEDKKKDGKKNEDSRGYTDKDIQQQQVQTKSVDNSYDVNTGANEMSGESLTDSTAGFHNAFAKNNKGKKKTASENQSYKAQKSTVQKPAQSYSGDEIALNKEIETPAVVTLNEIELAGGSGVKREEADDYNNPASAIITLPEYPGGVEAMQKFFREKINKPAAAKGQIVASFTVNKDGSISNAKIITPISGCDACSAEVLRVIKLMPQWKPASSAGKPINITYNLPVKF